MNEQEFNNDDFKRKLGINPSALQPYNFKRYREINQNLTEDVYRFLRSNRSEWKILCGLNVFDDWGNKILNEVPHLKHDNLHKESYFLKFRYFPERYLNLEW
ncbi:hypothetical protein NU08_1612 [Flavobacterium anhuiense]|uniref:Uncharacterized protein n=1 Tax=Flavobacterium anhuiense TaxID=459526 RepID=A0A444W0K0_9FLAO|nr:hypothetical protein [Flavobacterium anhuiense]RYJ39304.1 hypothetical protein NU08_1612 [Flavobacterium anhuiense]